MPEIEKHRARGSREIHDAIGELAVKIIDAHLCAAAFKIDSHLECGDFFRLQIGIAPQAGVIQQIFVQAGRAKRLAVKRFHAGLRCWRPDQAGPGNCIQREAADFVSLEAGDQSQIVEQLMIELPVNCFSKSPALCIHRGRNCGCKKLLAFDTVDQSSHR